jgi:hypothetical protein
LSGEAVGNRLRILREKKRCSHDNCENHSLEGTHNLSSVPEES